MTTTPPQRPEGALIEAARKRRQPRMSGRQAAEKSGISESRWRHIIKGYSTPKAGVYVEVEAPADTLARMAFAVGLSPDELREVGREDAAEFLADTLGTGSKPTPSYIHDVSQHPSFKRLQLLAEGTPPEVAEAGLNAAVAIFEQLKKATESHTPDSGDAPDKAED